MHVNKKGGETAMFGQKKGEQRIECHVGSCRFNDSCQTCGLDTICVGNCGCERSAEPAETECCSFKKR
mgnify:CR=1 FL=1